MHVVRCLVPGSYGCIVDVLRCLLPERYGCIVDVLCCLLPERYGSIVDVVRCLLCYLDVMGVLWTLCAVCFPSVCLEDLLMLCALR